MVCALGLAGGRMPPLRLVWDGSDGGGMAACGLRVEPAMTVVMAMAAMAMAAMA